MQHLPGKRALALVAALALATAGSAFAQDTTDVGRAAIDTTQPAGGAVDTAGVDTSAVTDTSAVSDTTDTSGVQNPPGYRGMERDTTMFPPNRGGADSATSDTTGATGDTSGADKNDGYRSERPAAADSAAHDSMQHGGAGDTTAGTPDSTQ
jgi:hypothetical protein